MILLFHLQYAVQLVFLFHFYTTITYSIFLLPSQTRVGDCWNNANTNKDGFDFVVLKKLQQ